MKKKIYVALLVMLLLIGAVVAVLFNIINFVSDGIEEAVLAAYNNQLTTSTQMSVSSIKQGSFDSQSDNGTQKNTQNNKQEASQNDTQTVGNNSLQSPEPSIKNNSVGLDGDGANDLDSAKTNENIDKQDQSSGVDVTFSDKAFVASVVLTKLSPDEINMLLAMLQDGLTNEEKKAAKQIAYSKFDSEELATIYEIYGRYGGMTSTK